MSFDSFMNQTATWRTYNDDPWGEAEAHTDEPIKVRWSGGGKQVRDPQGNITVAEAIVYTRAKVNVGDALIHPDDDPDAAGVKMWPVQGVKPRAGRNGEEHHREIAL